MRFHGLTILSDLLVDTWAYLINCMLLTCHGNVILVNYLLAFSGFTGAEVTRFR